MLGSFPPELRGRLAATSLLRSREPTLSCNHPFVFFLANGWETLNLRCRVLQDRSGILLGSLESWTRMQTIIQVFSKGSKSLRDRVLNDSHLAEFGLEISEQKRQTRSPGWSKLHMKNSPWAINIEWHAASRTLICRIVTRGGNPHTIAGTFISFLLARCFRQIASIHIQPQS